MEYISSFTYFTLLSIVKYSYSSSLLFWFTCCTSFVFVVLVVLDVLFLSLSSVFFVTIVLGGKNYDKKYWKF